MDLIVQQRDRQEQVAIERTETGYRVRVGGSEYQVDVADSSGPARSLIVDGAQHEVAVYPENHHRYTVSTTRGTETVEIMDPLTHLAHESRDAGKGGAQHVTAYMPGRVVKLLVEPGETIAVGQGLLVLEAMKMENEIQAERPGVVSKILVAEGQAVDGGDVLIELE